MPKLQAKGSSVSDDFMKLSVPAERAKSEAQIVLAALRDATEALLDLVVTPSKAISMEGSALRTFMLLKGLYSSIEEELKRIDFTLEVIENKLTDFGGLDDDLE